MSIVSPPLVGAGQLNVGTTGFPAIIQPFPNITPFTYRDGMSWAETLEDYQHWILNELVPHVDATGDSIASAYNAASQALASAMSQYTVEIGGDREAFNASVAATLTQMGQAIAANTAAMTTQVNAANTARVGSEAARDLSEQWAAQSHALQDTAVSALIQEANSATQQKLFSGFVQNGVKSVVGKDNTVVGSGGWPNADNGVNTVTGFTASTKITDPNVTFMGALAGFAFYTGTPGPNVGSIQGGAMEAFVYADKGDWTRAAVLGFEGIGSFGGTVNTPLVIGMQGTAQARDTASVTNLIAIQGRGPFNNGTGVVTNAYTFKGFEPTTGTQRYTWYGAGRHRFSKGNHANVLEICNTGDLLQWASNGVKFTGYASDGGSIRVDLDPGDAAAQRVRTITTQATTKHFSATHLGNEVAAMDALGHPVVFAANRKATVGASGTAAALPAQPVFYATIASESGNLYAVPAYNLGA